MIDETIINETEELEPFPFVAPPAEPPAEPRVWVYPGTSSRFIGINDIAKQSGYVSILESEYDLLCEGKLEWEDGTLVPAIPVEKPKPKRPYDVIVSSLIREKYSQNDVEAILANYLAEPENEAYKAEFEAFSAYRAECKAKAKEEIGEC